MKRINVKLKIGDTAFYVERGFDKIGYFKVDSIVINNNGVTYVDEWDIEYPEENVFKTKIEADNALKGE